MDRKDELLKQVFELTTVSESILDSSREKTREKTISQTFFRVDSRDEGKFLIGFQDVSQTFGEGSLLVANAKTFFPFITVTFFYTVGCAHAHEIH